MPGFISLPMQFKLVQLQNPVTTNSAVTTDVISTKNGLRTWIVVNLTQAAAHATSISLKQATSVAGTTNKAGPTVAIWANEDTAATDTLVKQTSAASYTVAADVKNKMVVFEIDPVALDVAGGYDCLYLLFGASSQSTNFVDVTAVIDTKYKQATPPSVIID